MTDVAAIKKRKPSLRDCLWTAHAFGTGMADDDDSDSDSMTPLVDVDVSDDEDYEPNAMPAPATAVRRSARNRDKEVDYVHEKHDNHFSEYKGLSHFGRTRKGGDMRPNGGNEEPPKATRNSVTMLNFFATPGKRPRPRPKVVIDLSKTKKKRASPTTRTRWGRPPKSNGKSVKILQMQNRVKRTAADGALSVAPTPRRKWNGTVNVFFFLLFVSICNRNLPTVTLNAICNRRLSAKLNN